MLDTPQSDRLLRLSQSVWFYERIRFFELTKSRLLQKLRRNEHGANAGIGEDF